MQPDSVSFNDDDGVFEASVDWHFENKQIFQIVHEGSGTVMPGFHPLDDDVVLVDLPGLGLSPFDEIANQSKLKRIMSAAEKVVLCLVIKSSILDADRGRQYLSFATSVVRLLKLDAFADDDDVALPILPLITSSGSFNRPGKFRTLLYDTPAAFLDQKMEALQATGQEREDKRDIINTLSGPEFPIGDELRQVKNLMNHIKESYRVFDPTDDLQTKNEDQNI